MKKIRIAILPLIFLSFISSTVYGGVKINPDKIYQEGIKLYNRVFPSQNPPLSEKKENDYLRKAVKYFEKAIESGLHGDNLKDAYSKTFYCAVHLNDFDRIKKYNSKAEKNPWAKKFFSKLEFQCTNKHSNVTFKDTLGEDLSIDLPNNYGILMLVLFMKDPKDNNKILHNFSFYRPGKEVVNLSGYTLSIDEVIHLDDFLCYCINN